MLLDPDVCTEGVQPPIWYACGIAEAVYRANGCVLTITSLVDGKHGEHSLHAKGFAADLRTRGLTALIIKLLYNTLKSILNPLGYDVVWESDHIHLEYDPKEGECWWKIGEP